MATLKQRKLGVFKIDIWLKNNDNSNDNDNSKNNNNKKNNNEPKILLYTGMLNK